MGIPFAFAQLGAVLAACNASRETTTRLYVEHLVRSGKAQVHAYGACVELALKQLHWLRHGSRLPAWTDAQSSVTTALIPTPPQTAHAQMQACSPVGEARPPKGKVIAFPGQSLRDG